jgi:hypothetical protein
VLTTRVIVLPVALDWVFRLPAEQCYCITEKSSLRMLNQDFA